MNITSTPPESFPGKEFSQQWGDESIYEIDHVQYAHTTGVGETIVIPDIEYRAVAEVTWGSETEYIDGGAAKIGEALLDEDQRQAIEKAKEIEQRRAAEDPTVSNFVGLRQVRYDNNGQLYICMPKEGGRLQSSDPFAVARSVEKLGIIDFATATLGYYGFFKFNAADIGEFVPVELKDKANAYVMIDDPRVIVGVNGEYDYQIVKMLLLDVETDLEFPLDQLDRTERIVIVEEDGTETVKIYNPGKQEVQNLV